MKRAVVDRNGQWSNILDKIFKEFYKNSSSSLKMYVYENPSISRN